MISGDVGQGLPMFAPGANKHTVFTFPLISDQFGKEREVVFHSALEFALNPPKRCYFIHLFFIITIIFLLTSCRKENRQ